jgi:hypothetical protein
VEIFSKECRDLIEKLTALQPELRLGAGENGTQQDFKSLKTHKWFQILLETENIGKITYEDQGETHIHLNRLFEVEVPLQA